MLEASAALQELCCKECGGGPVVFKDTHITVIRLFYKKKGQHSSTLVAALLSISTCNSTVEGEMYMPVIEKCDCVRKCAENNGYCITKYFNGQKLSDGKTIGGAGRLTDNLATELLQRRHQTQQRGLNPNYEVCSSHSTTL